MRNAKKQPKKKEAIMQKAAKKVAVVLMTALVTGGTALMSGCIIHDNRPGSNVTYNQQDRGNGSRDRDFRELACDSGV
jgi:hypothetical protein